MEFEVLQAILRLTTTSIIKLQEIQQLMSVVEKAENAATLCQVVLQATSLSLRSQTTRALCILISSLGLKKTPESASIWDRDRREGNRPILRIDCHSTEPLYDTHS